MISDPAENERTVTRIMARLIDADKRIAEIKKQYCTDCENYGGVKCRACWVDDAMCLIDDATTVDAVKVVRCRDCKHFKPKINEKGRMSCVCTNEAIGFFEWMMCENDFCSYGERKDNG